MISPQDKSRIIALAEKYRVAKILLFGSSAHKEGQDIDLAVEGLAGAQFFKFYGELIFSLSKPVDLIDLSGKSGFVRMVAAEGVPIYGRA